MIYYIYRFYFSGRRCLVKVVDSLEKAQEHCNDPETREEGKWFDGYTQKDLGDI